MTKQISMDELTWMIASGSSVGFGGGGVQRKPMAAAAAIGRAGIRDLEVCSFLAGPETDLLIGLGLVRQLRFAFLGFDMFGLGPCFRTARQAGQLPVVEYSEALIMTAYEAAAKNLPSLTTRFGLGTDLMTVPNSPFREVPCPFSGEALIAVPALSPDLAIVHVNEADRQGNALIHGDSYADMLLIQASRKVVLTAERVVDTLPEPRRARSTFISRLWVDHVVEAPRGGGFTAVFPDYRFDMPAILEYQKNATDPAWLSAKLGDL